MTKRKHTGKTPSPFHASENRIFQETRVYVMGNFPVFWKAKFGISDNTKNRRSNVSETTFGLVFTVCSFDLPFGKNVEGFVHWLYGWGNRPFRNGSGRTEWFLAVNPLFGSAMLFLCWKTGLRPDWYVYAGSFFFPFFWIDGLLWLLFFRALGWLLALALFCLILWI